MGPMVGVLPSGTLSAFRVVNDYSGNLRVSDFSPVGGRVSRFIRKWQVVTSDPFILSVVRNGFQILVQSSHSENHRDPEGSTGEIRDLISKNAIVQINDFPSLCLSPIFCDPQEIGGSTCHPESQRVQSFYFNPTLQDGDSEYYSSTAVSKRLGLCQYI